MASGYYAWRHWRLSGGIPSQRPVGLPAFIPPHWWVRLALYRALVAKPPIGHLAEFGALFDNPNGGIEDMRMMYRHGLRWAMYNLRNPGWNPWLVSADRAGITVGPWMRVYTKDDLHVLIFNAIWHQEPLIGVNVEYTADKKTKITPAEILDAIKSFDGQVVLIVSPWMENDVDWRSLAKRCVFLIEGYTNEGFSIPPLVEHAYKCGARTVAVMAGVYTASHPVPQSLLDWRKNGWDGAPILYLGDNLGADEDRWAAWSP